MKNWKQFVNIWLQILILLQGEQPTSEDGSREIIKMADRFINIDELNIDLIDQVNPFQRAYEVISRDIDADASFYSGLSFIE